MVTTAKLEFESDNFALKHTFNQYPTVQFEVFQTVAHKADTVFPLLWVNGEEKALTDIESTLSQDGSVAAVQHLTDLGNAKLLQIEWADRINTLVHIFVEEGSIILNVSAEAGGWTFRVLCIEHCTLSRIHDRCTAHNLPFNIECIRHPDFTRNNQYGLNQLQRQTLLKAHKNGYYEVPRDIGLEELSEGFRVSHQTLSERVRRAHGTLIKNTLLRDDSNDLPDLVTRPTELPPLHTDD